MDPSISGHFQKKKSLAINDLSIKRALKKHDTNCFVPGFVLGWRDGIRTNAPHQVKDR
jgi:hypothetical protein